MVEISRKFIGIWIPKEIWLDKRLTYFERCLLAEIHSLCGDDGCYASNEYLCEFFNERERKIQEGISKLKELGFIYVESFDGRTRVLKSNLSPKNDKSLFSTSEVLKSAPQTCRNPHPSHYIESKEDIKEQQQQSAAAAFSNPSKKETLPRIYGCLQNVDIPDSDKIEITQRYDADTVKNAIEWATNPQTKINKGLSPAIKWACQNKPEVPKNEIDLVASNKAYAKQYDGMKSSTGTVTVLNACVEIDYGTPYKTPLAIVYTEITFKEILHKALKSVNIKPL